MVGLFDGKTLPKDQPFSFFDGHQLFLVSVPFKVMIATNGTVIAEWAPYPPEQHLEALIDRVLLRREPKK